MNSSEGFQNYVFHLSIDRTAMKTQHFADIWKATLPAFALSNYTPMFEIDW